MEAVELLVKCFALLQTNPSRVVEVLHAVVKRVQWSLIIMA